MTTTSFLWAAQSSVVLANGNLASTSNGSSVATTAALDVRSGGNAILLVHVDFLLAVKWTTVTNIAAGTIVADLYLVPSLDGTNANDVDQAAAASFIPLNFRVGSFRAAKVPTSNTLTYFAITGVVVKPNTYTVYLINRSGQTFSNSSDGSVTAYATNLKAA
jgi:hypothetical protein